MMRLLTLACLFLVAAIAAEVCVLQSGSGASGAVPVGPGPAPPRMIRQSDQSETARDQWLSIVVGRPLFAPDRRQAAGPPTASVGLPRLTGIIASPSQALAIFQAAGEARPVVARGGETVAGWEVTTIGRDVVILSKANDRVELRPRFTDGQPSGTPAVAARPAPPRWEAAAAAGVLRARWSNPQLQP
jgi:hypothetical protein